MAYQMAPVLVTLNDLEGHFPRSFPFAGLSSAIHRTFVQYFTSFQLTARLRCPLARAGLLVDKVPDGITLISGITIILSKHSVYSARGSKPPCGKSGQSINPC